MMRAQALFGRDERDDYDYSRGRWRQPFTAGNATIIGPAGIGKTSAITHYAKERNQTYLLSATAESGNAAKHLFRQFCDALRAASNNYIDASTQGSIANIQHQLFQYDFSGHVLVIDEAQNLNQQAIREMLTLNDQAGLSVVFVGNSEVIRRAHIDKGPLATIGSRIGFRRLLKIIAAQDAEALAASYGVTDPEGLALARKIGAHSQARGLASVLQTARSFASGGAIAAAPIRAVFDEFPHFRPA